MPLTHDNDKYMLSCKQVEVILEVMQHNFICVSGVNTILSFPSTPWPLMPSSWATPRTDTAKERWSAHYPLPRGLSGTSPQRYVDPARCACPLKQFTGWSINTLTPHSLSSLNRGKAVWKRKEVTHSPASVTQQQSSSPTSDTYTIQQVRQLESTQTCYSTDKIL